MFGLGADRKILRVYLQRRLLLAGSHPARPRHPRRLRPVEVGDGEIVGARARRAPRHGDDGLDSMALIGRLFVVFFAFLLACFAAGAIVVVAVLYPEFSDLGQGEIDQSAINVVIGFGFIFLSGFALLPALIVVLITEAFYVRGVLTFSIWRGCGGAACYV